MYRFVSQKEARVLELAVLGLLKEKPMSGYELQKQLTAKLGAFWRVSFGSLYPCLKRLSAQGALAVIDSPSMSRKKHVYRLTESGELLFLELLETADAHDLEQDRFRMRLAFFRYLAPENRIDQLERRRGYLQQRLRDLRGTLRTARDRMDAYTLSLLDHGLEEREREIEWLDRLIAAERQGGLPPVPPQPKTSGARPRKAGRSARRSTRPATPPDEPTTDVDLGSHTDPAGPAASGLQPSDHHGPVSNSLAQPVFRSGRPGGRPPARIRTTMGTGSVPPGTAEASKTPRRISG
jgi:DNA-binding PadR family transcriptional regulator